MLFFANKFMLWFLAATAVPVLVHLFARTRPPSAPFSSLRFLQRVASTTMRARKPKDWLLLLLRTAAVLLFALAMLQPLLISRNDGRSADAHHVVLLVDRSGSMAATEGAHSRFRRACDMAGELLGSLDPASANIVWIDAEPDSVFPESGPNVPYLIETLKRAQPLAEPGNLRAGYDKALALLDATEGTKEIIIASDFQRGAWDEVELPVVPGVKITRLAAGDGDLENVAITALDVLPARPVVGQDVFIRCTVTNHSPDKRRVTVFADIGGARQSATLELPANGSSETVFPVVFDREGEVAVNTRIDEDGFPFDDIRHAVIDVTHALALTVVAAVDSPEAMIARRMTAALPWLECTVVPTIDAALAMGSDELFLCGWDGSDAVRLHDRAANGEPVIVQPGDGVTSKAMATLFGGTWAEAGKFRTESAGPEAFAVAVKSPDHPVFRLFASGEFGSPADGRYRQRVRLPAEAFNDLPVSTLLEFSDHVPALVVSRADALPVHLWNLPLDPKNHTWAGENFVPFFAEFLLNVRGARVGSFTGSKIAGEKLSWTPDDRYQPESISLVNEAGELQEVTRIEHDGVVDLLSVQALPPGSYRWMSGEQMVRMAVVNFPPGESDLRVLAAEDVRMGGAINSRDLDSYTALREGFPVWMWLVATVLLLLLAESLVARWALTPVDASPPPK